MDLGPPVQLGRSVDISEISEAYLILSLVILQLLFWNSLRKLHEINFYWRESTVALPLMNLYSFLIMWAAGENKNMVNFSMFVYLLF